MSSDLLLSLLIQYPILVFSLSLHEFGHAIAAKWCGDRTAEAEGRITLNPLSHIDPFGTVIFPISAIIWNLNLIGWARPVPVVAGNMDRPRGGEIIAVAAGPMMNLFIAIGATILLQAFEIFTVSLAADNPEMSMVAFGIIQQTLIRAIILNVSLVFFNLIPVAPLDGSHFMRHFLDRYGPRGLYEAYLAFSQYSFVLFFVLMIGGGFRWDLGKTAMPVANLFLSYASLPFRFHGE